MTQGGASQVPLSPLTPQSPYCAVMCEICHAICEVRDVICSVICRWVHRGAGTGGSATDGTAATDATHATKVGARPGVVGGRGRTAALHDAGLLQRREHHRRGGPPQRDRRTGGGAGGAAGRHGLDPQGVPDHQPRAGATVTACVACILSNCLQRNPPGVPHLKPRADATAQHLPLAS